MQIKHRKQINESNDCRDGTIARVWVGGSKTASPTFPGTLVKTAVRLGSAGLPPSPHGARASLQSWELRAPRWQEGNPQSFWTPPPAPAEILLIRVVSVVAQGRENKAFLSLEDCQRIRSPLESSALS